MKYQLLLAVMLLLSGCSAPPKEEVKKKETSSVSFVAVGDNLYHQCMLDEAKTSSGYDFTGYYKNIKKYIQADYCFVNQETILGGGAPSGYPLFSAPDSVAGDLQKVGFNVVNGATNHAYDQGASGILHSIQVFNKYPRMTYLGLYKNEEEKQNIKIVEKNGIKIAFVSFNQYVNGVTYQKKLPYMINFHESTMMENMKKARESADIVIASCHWGVEYDQSPNAFQKNMAQKLADAGADVIIGTHPHTLQDVEYIQRADGKRTLVAYSLGNFVSGMLEESCQLEGMLSFDIEKKKIKNVVFTPLVNYYTLTGKRERHDFSVYRLKDYTNKLMEKHGFPNLTIPYMKEEVKQKVKNIKIDM